MFRFRLVSPLLPAVGWRSPKLLPVFTAQPHQCRGVPVPGGRLRVLLFSASGLAYSGQWAAYSAGQRQKGAAFLHFCHGFLVLANIMSGTGQTAALAGGFSAVFGPYYAALAALVGMLGSFITGSNMSSNILFGSFQMTTAELVGLQPAPILAAQTVGGSAGSLISPSKIVLGATTAGHPEMVGSIIRKLLPVALLFSLTSGAVVLLSGLILG